MWSLQSPEGGHLAAAAAFFHGVCTGNRYIGGFKPYRPTSKLAHTVHSRLRVRAQPTTCTVQCTQLLLLLCRYPPTQKFKFKTYAHQTLCKKTPPHTRGFFSNRSHQRPAVGWGGFDVRQCRVLSILLSIMAFPATTNGWEQLLLGNSKSIYHVCNCFHFLKTNTKSPGLLPGRYSA